jgi:hypothetical protein
MQIYRGTEPASLEPSARRQLMRGLELSVEKAICEKAI